MLGEGPVWDDQRQRLLWVDILPGLVHRFDSATGGDDVFRAGKPVGAVGLRREGGLVIAVEDGFALLDRGWQRVRQVAVIGHAGPRARFNDGKCDPAGRFLAGTMAYDLTPGAGSLYRLDPDRSVTRLLTGVTISNGLAWTGDGTTLYYIDSPTQGIDAFGYDLGTGRLANRRRLVEIPPDAGLPDGMTIDEDGCLWVALYGGSAVHRYTPAGKLDVMVSFPATNITCPVFGGPGSPRAGHPAGRRREGLWRLLRGSTGSRHRWGNGSTASTCSRAPGPRCCSTRPSLPR